MSSWVPRSWVLNGEYIVTFVPKVSESLVQYQAQAAAASISQEREKARTLCDATEAIHAILSEVAIETQSASIEEIARDEEKLEVLENKA